MSQGNGKLVWWLMATFAVIIIGGAGFFGSTLYGSVKSLEASMTAKGERIATLESSYSFISQRLNRIEDTLQDVAEKVSEIYHEYKKKRDYESRRINKQK